MKFKKQIILFCFISVIAIPINHLYSQAIPAKPTRQSSLEAFSRENYEKAYAQFRELLLTYTKDPLYKYYSGVCLVKLKKDPGEAINLLQQALQGTGAIKTLPSDGLFYLGRAQQMAGKFSEATGSFNLYTGQVGKKTAKEMGVPEFLQECVQKIGQLTESELKPAEVVNKVNMDSLKAEARPVIKEPIQQNVEKPTNARVDLPEDYEKILGQAVEFQFKADSVSALINKQKNELEKLSAVEKQSLKTKILENEKIAAAFQLNADKKYREAQLALNPDQDTTLPRKESAGLYEYKPVQDTAKKVDNKIVKIADKQTDTTFSPVKSQLEIFSFFEVSAKPPADVKEKIVIDPEVPAGLIYRIQLAVFRNPVAPGYFKGISPVYGFKIEGTDKTIYYAGMFRKSSDAKKALAAVKNKGFKDAFIVALAGDKRVSPDRAILMEKEWGGKPFYSIEKSLPATQRDTITPTLTFRVEVIRSLKPLTEDMVEGIRKMAGSRGMDIQLLEDGEIVYLIGKFITFETAAEYADLLKRNGYHEAQVVARLGKKEIPIETARQLFENLK